MTSFPVAKILAFGHYIGSVKHWDPEKLSPDTALVELGTGA